MGQIKELKKVQNMKFIFILILSMISVSSYGQSKNTQRTVMTWVPPYNVNASLDMLEKSFNGVEMKNSITHIGLQFWIPTEEGGVDLVKKFNDKYNIINDSKIKEFLDWGIKNDVKILLCVYNNIYDNPDNWDSTWDWALASKSFGKHKDIFINALIKEVGKHKLDGIDIDFEGLASDDMHQVELDKSKDPFNTFIFELSKRLKSKDKILTVDTFAHEWNAPNRTWWLELLPKIDGLNVMGYEETGANLDGWRSYDSIKKAAKEHPEKLRIGLTASDESESEKEWQKKHLQSSLNWIVAETPIGLAFWDAQIESDAWKTKKVWEKISKIRGTGKNQ